MNGKYLTIRLTESEAELIARLGAATGLTKTEIVKRALATTRRWCAGDSTPSVPADSGPLAAL